VYGLSGIQFWRNSTLVLPSFSSLVFPEVFLLSFLFFSLSSSI